MLSIFAFLKIVILIILCLLWFMSLILSYLLILIIYWVSQILNIFIVIAVFPIAVIYVAIKVEKEKIELTREQSDKLYDEFLEKVPLFKEDKIKRLLAETSKFFDDLLIMLEKL